MAEWFKPEIKEEIQTVETSYKKYYVIAGVVIVSSLAWYYKDEIMVNAIVLYEWINSFRSNPSNPGGDSGGNASTNNNTSITTNIPRIDSEHNSPDIELVDKGKNKVFTSPSLEDLNEQAEDSWSQASSSNISSSSNSSTETITQEGYDKYFVSPEQSEFLNKFVQNWKLDIPFQTRDKIEFIESNIHITNNFMVKNLMVQYLCDIEIALWDLIKLIPKKSEDNWENIQIFALNITVEKLNDWINEYNNKIFKN